MTFGEEKQDLKSPFTKLNMENEGSSSGSSLDVVSPELLAKALGLDEGPLNKDGFIIESETSKIETGEVVKNKQQQQQQNNTPPPLSLQSLIKNTSIDTNVIILIIKNLLKLSNLVKNR